MSGFASPEARREYMRNKAREYYRADPERFRQRAAKYRALNPEARKKTERQYRAAHRDACKARWRAYYEKNKDRLKAANKRYWAARPARLTAIRRAAAARRYAKVRLNPLLLRRYREYMRQLANRHTEEMADCYIRYLLKDGKANALGFDQLIPAKRALLKLKRDIREVTR